jgi:hypothetical protein
LERAVEAEETGWAEETDEAEGVKGAIKEREPAEG